MGSPSHSICSASCPPPPPEALFVFPGGQVFLTPNSYCQVSLLNNRPCLVPKLLSWALTLPSGILDQVIPDCICSLKCKYLPTPTLLQIPLEIGSPFIHEKQLSRYVMFQLITNFFFFIWDKSVIYFKLHDIFKSDIGANISELSTHSDDPFSHFMWISLEKMAFY